MSELGSYMAALVRSSAAARARGSRLAATFDELPLPLAEWIASPKHMNLQGPPDAAGEPTPYLSPVQFGVLRHAEQIYFPDMYEELARENLKWRMVRYVNTIWMMVGKGGGKDMIAGMTQLRLAYLLLCLRQPQRYMGIGATSHIHMLNTASSEGQAEQIYFAELKGLLEHAPFFRGLYRQTAKAIEYDKRITAVSGNSKEEAQEGMNLLLGVLDEIDAFRTKEELEKTARTSRGAMLNADGIYNMMKTSGSSRYPVNYKILGLSWPRYVGSFMWNHYDEGLRDNERYGSSSRVYVVKATTWESNPTKRREMYDLDYRDDPELSRARYECEPPESEDPYFKNKIAVRQGFSRPFPLDHLGREVPPCIVSYRWGHPDQTDLELTALNEFRRMRGVAPREGWQMDLTWAEWFVCADGFPRAIHVDTGLRHDRTGVAMAHVRGWASEMVPTWNEVEQVWEDVEQRRPLVTIDLALALAAPPATREHPKGEVELRWIRRVLFELVGRGFPLARVTFDGYQCLSGDTLIPLLDGTRASMEELTNRTEPFWVYSSTPEGRIVPGRCVRAWQTGEEELYEVLLDNGEVVRCTGSHPFMLRGGGYVPAEELTPGVALMPLYRKVWEGPTHNGKYEKVQHNCTMGNGQRWQNTHAMVSSYFEGRQPNRTVVHHANFNSLDNRPENLVRMSYEDHTALHASLRNINGGFREKWADPVWRAAHTERLKKKPIGSPGRGSVPGRDSHRYRSDVTVESITEAFELALARGDSVNLAAMCGYLKCQSGQVILTRLREAGYGGWRDFRNQRGHPVRWTKVKTNHKVVAVHRTGKVAPVYDLEVEDHHNFALEAGVFVHNSADSIQLLNHAGIETELFSLDRNMEGYSTAKSVLYTGGMQAHKNELLVKELLALTIVNGKKIDHPPNGTKDLADAWAGAVRGAIQVNEVGGTMRDVWMPGMVDQSAVLRGEVAAAAPPGMLDGMPDDLVGLGGTFLGAPDDGGP